MRDAWEGKGWFAALMAVIAIAAFLAGSGVKDGRAQPVPQDVQQVRGIDWVNFSTGTDFNGDPGTRGAPMHFAEIHLVIRLDKDVKDSVHKWAEEARSDVHKKPENLKKIRAALDAAVESTPGRDLSKKLIAQLDLR
jgi:hypothetical protein